MASYCAGAQFCAGRNVDSHTAHCALTSCIANIQLTTTNPQTVLVFVAAMSYQYTNTMPVYSGARTYRTVPTRSIPPAPLASTSRPLCSLHLLSRFTLTPWPMLAKWQPAPREPQSHLHRYWFASRPAQTWAHNPQFRRQRHHCTLVVVSGM